jgi:hypothetical protein
MILTVQEKRWPSNSPQKIIPEAFATFAVAFFWRDLRAFLQRRRMGDVARP